MDGLAKAEQQPGESFYEAYDRLATTDETFQKALRRYNELDR
jgi:hypothetical protein